MAKELKSLRRRQQSRKNSSGGGSRFLPVMAVIVLLLVISVAGLFLYDRTYAPSREMADKTEYFGVSGDDVALFLNDVQALKDDGTAVRAKCINGGVFIPFEWVMSELNRRYYWAKDLNAILYTLPEETVKYGLGDTLKDGSTAFIRMGDSTDDLYLNIKLVAEYTDISYKSYISDDTKRVFISNDLSEYKQADVKRKEAVRLLGGVKSKVLTNLEAGQKVKILESLEKWSRVSTEDGYVGWLRNSHLGEIKDVTPESDFQAPEYTHITRSDGNKVVLGFHQITLTEANNYLEDMTKDATGMNVVAPTWFVLTGDDGTFTCYWTKDYVDKAHAKGYQVWATVNNFDGGDIDESVFLKSTALRAKLVDNLVATAVAGEIDGLNIDFELIPERLGRDYVQFMKELAVACRKAGIILSVDCYVPYSYNSYYDIEQLGENIDYVIIMCYDEHYAGSEEGSVASIGYLNHAISETQKMMDTERIIIAVPFYTRVWMTDSENKTTSEALGIASSLEWVEKNNVQLSWNSEIGQNYGEFMDGNTLKKVWLEDEKSMKLKLDVIKESGCGGVAAWKLGQEPAGFWSILDLNNVSGS